MKYGLVASTEIIIDIYIFLYFFLSKLGLYYLRKKK